MHERHVNASASFQYSVEGYVSCRRALTLIHESKHKQSERSWTS